MDRYKNVFETEEEVKMKDFPVLYKEMIGEVLIIRSIEAHDGCESGFMLRVEHKASGKQFKKLLDTNWFQKIVNNKN